MKQTKTHTGMVLLVAKVLGNGIVRDHQPTEFNLLGQSGIHTFIDDVLDIVRSSSGDPQAYHRLWDYLIEGSAVIAVDNNVVVDKEGNS